jgi:hypothetical protein
VRPIRPIRLNRPIQASYSSKSALPLPSASICLRSM